MMPRILLIFMMALALSACAVPKGVTQGEVESRGAELDELSASKIISVLDAPYLGARPVPIARDSEFSSGVVFARHITMNRRGSLADICAVLSRLTGLSISIDASSGRAAGAAAPSEGTSSGGSGMDAQLAAALGLDSARQGGAASPETPTPQRAAPRPSGGVRIAYEGSVKGLLDLLSARFGLAWKYNPASGVVFAATAIRTFTIHAAPGAITYSNNITNASSDSSSGGGVVMNNQPIPIQAVKREAYLASSSMTTTDTGETSSLTPGEITTGFAMTVIPHILEGRRVVLQYTVNLSSLDDLAEFSSGDSTIQLPKVSTRSYSQRMTIKMGQTLVLAGFEQEIDGRDTAGGFLGFGRSRGYTKSLMVITISTESGDV